MGYLLTIEAPDASGKSTQIELLCKRLAASGRSVRKVRFPNYGSDACKPVEAYLNGALGKDPHATNAYAASVLFAVDRYFSYQTDWKKELEKPESIILLDRYTTSNAIHQLAKLTDMTEREAFLAWLYDLEFGKMGLPKPDDTLFLDVPPCVSLSLLKARAVKDASHVTDIHEADTAYLAHCYEAAKFAASRLHWHTVTCAPGEKMRTADDIADEIFFYVSARIAEKERKDRC